MILSKIRNNYLLKRLKRHFINNVTFQDADTVKIFRGAYVYLCWESEKTDIEIGNNCLIYGMLASQYHGKIAMGQYCALGAGSQIRSVDSVSIGDYTAISYNVIIADNNNHPVNPHDRMIMRTTPPGNLKRSWIYSDHAPIIIGRNCWIGENSRICKGVNIGDGCIVAANAVVTKSVPANCIVAGNPAKIVKTNIDTEIPRYFGNENNNII